MNEISTTSRNTPCMKKSCFFCYEMNRLEQPEKPEFTFSPLTIKKKYKPSPRKAAMTGCERLILFANIGKSNEDIGRLLPNLTYYNVRNYASLWRKQLGFKKHGNRFIVPVQLCSLLIALMGWIL